MSRRLFLGWHFAAVVVGVDHVGVIVSNCDVSFLRAHDLTGGFTICLYFDESCCRMPRVVFYMGPPALGDK
ncbi:unnamed protein product [Camellia sinensis]